MNSIATENLAVAYEDNLVVDDLDMQLPQGKITAIIGPNGCGKSTVLKAVGRILKPRSGMVYLNGEDIHRLSTKEIAQRWWITFPGASANGSGRYGCNCHIKITFQVSISILER